MQHQFGIVGVKNATVTMRNDEKDMLEVLARCANQENFAAANIFRNSRAVALQRLIGKDKGNAPRYFPVEEEVMKEITVDELEEIVGIGMVELAKRKHELAKALKESA